VPTAVAAWAVLLAACETSARASSVESGGTLDASTVGESEAIDRPNVSSATSVSLRPAPSADAYLVPSCASPTPDDQQRCLAAYLAESDLLLDRYYQALILRLKSEADASSSAAEPPAVQRLRSAQRAWVVYRDDRCRERTRQGEGPLWAPVRAPCLAEYSMRRAEELADVLAKRRARAPREEQARPSAPGAREPARSSARKSSHHARTRGG
jgi:uncharacterized protein YecT (DUF1311 family)